MAGYASLFTGGSEVPREREAPPPPPLYRILLVDDERNVLSALKRVFRQENYQVETAASGEEALTLLNQDEFQVIISDYKMPSMTGAELLRTVKAQHPEVIRIMLTGHADSGAVMGAIQEGAVYKFILKPWNDDDLRVTVGLALEQYDLIRRNRALQRENRQKSKEIQALSRMAVTHRSRLGVLLHKKGLLNEQQLQQLYKLQQSGKESTIKLLLDKGWVGEKEIRQLLRKELLIEEVSLPEFQVEPAVTELLPHSFCKRQLVVPLKLVGRRLMLAVADPLDEGMLEELRFVTGLEIQAVMAGTAAIRAKLEALYGSDGATPTIEELESLVSSSDPFESVEVVIEQDEDTSLEELLQSTEEPPAIRLVNAIILEAVRLGVSDIHIQPRTKSVVVRYRIDGVLLDKIHIPHALFPPLVSRIKVMAEMDIAERRRPQDGRITVKTPMRIVDLRISSLPTITGEKVVMRILDRNASVRSLDDLSFSSDDRDKVAHLIAKPQGIVLATGPTGSGKTTTLYSLLQHNANPTRNYVTIEDPVEFFLDMAGQVHVREKVGLDFPTALRAILRQDPDVILLGEIRDFETAEVAFHAALTGHQVFSTLHTNSAVATIARLLDLGLKPYVIASALEGIIAQRLVRRVCDACGEPVAADSAQLLHLGAPFAGNIDHVRQGHGCARCNYSGYKGRLGLYEVVAVDDELRDLISARATMRELNRHVASRSASLREDAYAKVVAGLTTPEEIIRVLGTAPGGGTEQIGREPT